MLTGKNETMENKSYARDQLSLNKIYRNGTMHTLTNNFEVLVAERMMMIASQAKQDSDLKKKI